jgi:hypothetical protein
MKEIYYENIVKYICFIRLLTKVKISTEDINKANQLINEFCPEFENLYGTTNMSYNLHVQLHLAEQCELIGGLNMASCFAGESCFYECSQRFHGTTNIPYQIAKNINLKRQIYEYLTLDEIDKIENVDLRAFYTKIRLSNHKINSSRTQPELKNLFVKKFSLLPLSQQILITQEFEITFNSNYEIVSGLKVKFNGTCLYFFNS